MASPSDLSRVEKTLEALRRRSCRNSPSQSLFLAVETNSASQSFRVSLFSLPSNFPSQSLLFPAEQTHLVRVCFATSDSNSPGHRWFFLAAETRVSDLVCFPPKLFAEIDSPGRSLSFRPPKNSPGRSLSLAAEANWSNQSFRVCLFLFPPPPLYLCHGLHQRLRVSLSLAKQTPTPEVC